MSVWAVIAAAGRGERLGLDRPKVFAKLGDRPLLAESLERFDASDWVDSIVVATPPDWEEPVILLAEELSCSKVVAAVPGGDTRAASVRAALAEVGDDAAVVLVHDAARPLVSEDVIERLMTTLNEGWDGVVPTLPIPDTVKRVNGDQIAETVDREQLVVAQTPQAFIWPVLRDAVAAGGDATDCASLVEAHGGRIKAVLGDARLVKITDRSDLELVERWL
jgi:2-C-methyl-D-erythritol 4-phosphate cytidylyltransferase